MKKKTKKAIAVGAGVAAVAAGAYFLTSTKKGKAVSKKIAKEVGKGYKAVKNISAKDVAKFSKKVKGQLGKMEKTAKSKIKKAVKKVAKKR